MPRSPIHGARAQDEVTPLLESRMSGSFRGFDQVHCFPDILPGWRGTRIPWKSTGTAFSPQAHGSSLSLEVSSQWDLEQMLESRKEA